MFWYKTRSHFNTFAEKALFSRNIFTDFTMAEAFMEQRMLAMEQEDVKVKVCVVLYNLLDLLMAKCQ
jgi:hypothetical protein